MEATLVSGSPVTMDYTPSGSDIAAGQVVEVGNLATVARLDIADGELGALDIGGGIYDMTAAGNYAAGTKVYWDDSANKVTTTSTTNPGFGWTLEAAAGDGSIVQVYHQPF